MSNIVLFDISIHWRFRGKLRFRRTSRKKRTPCPSRATEHFRLKRAQKKRGPAPRFRISHFS